MDTYIYKLRFTSPLHLSASGANYEDTETIVHSDTLYSALCSMAAQLYDADTWKPVFLPDKEDCPILLSSSMPYINNVLFLPKPMGYSPKGFDTWDYVDQKKWKRVNWLSWSTLGQMSQGSGHLDMEDTKDQIRYSCFLSPSEAKQLQQTSLYTFREVPRVTIDRVSNASTLFFYGDVTFSAGAGLYVLAQFDSKTAKSMFDATLRALGDTGIGGDRSVGKGLFEVETDGTPVSLPGATTDADTHLLLSLYTPTNQELGYIETDKSYFQTTSRQGWVSGRTFRRQTIRAFTEGSVLSMPRGVKPKGRLQSVLPQSFTGFTVYRNLRAFSIPFKII